MEITHELLVKVRNEIDRRGHARRALENSSGAVCLYGGFYTAVSGEPWKNPEKTPAATYRVNEQFAIILGFERDRETGSATKTATDWNDAPRRTKEDVLALLDEVVARTAPAPEDPFLNVATLDEAMVCT